MKRALFGAWRTAAGLARPSSAGNLRRLRARSESIDSLVIREANVADIPVLARLHVTTWNATHRPLLLKGPSVAIWFSFVVERADGQLVGFAQARKTDHPEFGGELRAILPLAPGSHSARKRRTTIPEPAITGGATSPGLRG